MNLNRSRNPRTFEAEIAHQAALLAERRADFAAKRKSRHGGFWDRETIEVVEPKPTLPDTPPECEDADCDTPARARKGGLCGTCYRRNRRALGFA